MLHGVGLKKIVSQPAVSRAASPASFPEPPPPPLSVGWVVPRVSAFDGQRRGNGDRGRPDRRRFRGTRERQGRLPAGEGFAEEGEKVGERQC